MTNTLRYTINLLVLLAFVMLMCILSYAVSSIMFHTPDQPIDQTVYGWQCAMMDNQDYIACLHTGINANGEIVLDGLPVSFEYNDEWQWYHAEWEGGMLTMFNDPVAFIDILESRLPIPQGITQ